MNKLIKKHTEEMNSDGHVIVTKYNRDGIEMYREDVGNWKKTFVSLKKHKNYEERKYRFEDNEKTVDKYEIWLNDGSMYIFDNPLEPGDFLVDKKGRIVYLTMPSGLIYHYVYDKYDNKLFEADSCGWCETNTYNDEGYLTHRVVKDSCGCVQNTDFYYDYDDNQYFLEETDDIYKGVVLVKHDFQGRLIYTKLLSDDSYLVKNDYDKNGKLVRHEDSGVVTEYFYNENGDLVKEMDSEGNYTTIIYEYWR